MKNLNADILIVGAGSAGVAAASSASKTTSKVLLIERNDFPGGKATASSVGTVCGLFLRSDLNNFKEVHGGFVRDFVKELASNSNTNPLKNQHGLKFLPYNIEAFKHLCLDKIQKSGVHYLKHTSLKKIRQVHNSITEVECVGPSGNFIITCKCIIDCSGHAVVSELANQPIIVDENLQSAAYIFEVKGIDSDSESVMNLSIKRSALRIEGSELKNYLLGTSVVPGSSKEDQMMVKMGIPDAMSHERVKIDSVELKSKKMIEEIFIHLKKTIPAFKNAAISHVSEEIGERIGKRPVGKYILNQKDVVHCKKWNDAISRGTWPIEKWSKGYRVKMGYFEENNFYHIPARCLKSQQIDNLFFAGRSISADEDAIASARVIGTCLATGYASGMLASGWLNQQSLESIVEKIQSDLFTDIPTKH